MNAHCVDVLQALMIWRRWWVVVKTPVAKVLAVVEFMVGCGWSVHGWLRLTGSWLIVVDSWSAHGWLWWVAPVRG